MEEAEGEEEEKNRRITKKRSIISRLPFVYRFYLFIYLLLLKADGGFDTAVLGPTNDVPLEITHPQDVSIMQEALRAATA